MNIFTALEASEVRNSNHAPSRRVLTLMLVLLLYGLFNQPVAAATATLPTYERVRLLEPARPIKDAELINQDGHPFRLSRLYGQVALVFFGFTNCPDVCSMAMQRLRELEKSSRPDLTEVVYVMISVDGERDTPDVMKRYLAKFSPRFIGLTGDSDSVKAMAAEFSAAFFKESATDKGSNYTVSHSPQIFVMDPQGRLRAEFFNASIEAMRGVTLALLNEVQEMSTSGEQYEN